LYSIRPTDGSGDFTFSRGSNLAATRVDVNGLIEKGRENLLLQSNNFDTTWGNSNSTETSGQAGYDGTNDAWRIDKTASGGYLVQGIGTSGVQTFSVYAKAGTTDWMQLLTLGSGTGSRYVFYDLTNGVIGSQSGSGTYGIDSNIESVGGGWYRCSLTFNTTLNDVRIYPAEANSVSATSGNIYIQDAQLEQGLVATDYIETGASTAQAGILEDMPRLDYSGGASCPSLLLEPQRTNMVRYSEGYVGFQTSISGTGVTPVVTQNAAISPDGTQNAFRVDLDRGAGNTSGDFSWIYQGSVVYAGENQVSVYLKAATSSDIGKEVALRASGSAQTLTLTADWKRHTMSMTLSATSDVGLYSRGGQNVDNAVSCFVYGFQVENNSSYPTSYIPTYGSSVTRGADSCTATSVSDLIGQEQGTMFLEAEAQSGFRTFSICDGSTSNRITIVHNVPSDFRVIPVYGGVVGTQLSTSYTSGNIKIAVAYGGGNYSMFVNGVKINSTSIGTFSSTLNKIDFAQGNGGNPFAGDVKQSVFFPTALTDAECIALTTI